MSEHGLVIIIHPSGTSYREGPDGRTIDNRFHVVDADNHDNILAFSFLTQEDAEAWASVYDKRWPQTPLTEVMREEEALRARERAEWKARLKPMKAIDGSNKLVALPDGRPSGCAVVGPSW
jgi:hypothetical protein